MRSRNVLIFHNGALGDFVVTWPLAVACGRLYPQSRVFYVTAGGKGKLAEDVLGIEYLDIEAGFSALWTESGAERLTGAARSLLKGAHLVLSFIAEPGSAWAENVRAISPAAGLCFLTTADRDMASAQEPAARDIARQLAAAAPALATATDQMVDSLEHRGFGRGLNGDEAGQVAVIHPGSGAKRKNWPLERFLELVGRLTDRGCPVSVVFGEVEAERWGPAAAESFAAHGACVIRPESLVELAGVLRAASVVVANDSGPAHLSAALGTPTVAIFGPTSHPTRWRPLGPRVQVINGATLDSIGVGEVLDQAWSMRRVREIANGT